MALINTLSVPKYGKGGTVVKNWFRGLVGMDAEYDPSQRGDKALAEKSAQSGGMASSFIDPSGTIGGAGGEGGGPAQPSKGGGTVTTGKPAPTLDSNNTGIPPAVNDRFNSAETSPPNVIGQGQTDAGGSPQGKGFNGVYGKYGTKAIPKLAYGSAATTADTRSSSANKFGDWAHDYFLSSKFGVEPTSNERSRTGEERSAEVTKGGSMAHNTIGKALLEYYGLDALYIPTDPNAGEKKGAAQSSARNANLQGQSPNSNIDIPNVNADLPTDNTKLVKEQQADIAYEIPEAFKTQQTLSDEMLDSATGNNVLLQNMKIADFEEEKVPEMMSGGGMGGGGGSIMGILGSGGGSTGIEDKTQEEYNLQALNGFKHGSLPDPDTGHIVTKSKKAVDDELVSFDGGMVIPRPMVQRYLQSDIAKKLGHQGFKESSLIAGQANQAQSGGSLAKVQHKEFYIGQDDINKLSPEEIKHLNKFAPNAKHKIGDKNVKAFPGTVAEKKEDDLNLNPDNLQIDPDNLYVQQDGKERSTADKMALAKLGIDVGGNLANIIYNATRKFKPLEGVEDLNPELAGNTRDYSPLLNNVDRMYYKAIAAAKDQGKSAHDVITNIFPKVLAEKNKISADKINYKTDIENQNRAALNNARNINNQNRFKRSALNRQMAMEFGAQKGAGISQGASGLSQSMSDLLQHQYDQEELALMKEIYNV